MKSFLLIDKKPTILWSKVPDNYFFEGPIPEGYSLAICPSAPYIVLDVDNHGNISGFDNIPLCILSELENHFGYSTKNNGHHYWLKYSGKEHLMNKTSKLGLDLRTNKGYVRWVAPGDVRDYINLIKETSETMNIWLEKLFK